MEKSHKENFGWLHNLKGSLKGASKFEAYFPHDLFLRQNINVIVYILYKCLTVAVQSCPDTIEFGVIMCLSDIYKLDIN